MLFYFHLITNSGLKMVTIEDYRTTLKEYIGKVVILEVGKEGSRVLTGCLDRVCEGHLTIGKRGMFVPETGVRSGGVQTPIRYDSIHTIKCGYKIIYQR